MSRGHSSAISEKERALIVALHKAGYSAPNIKKIAGRDEKTIRHVISTPIENPQTMLAMQEHIMTLALNSQDIVRRAMERITDEKLDSCSAPQLSMISGIFTDKFLSLQGLNRPVFNIVTVVNEAQKTMSKLEAQMATIQAAKAARGANLQ